MHFARRLRPLVLLLAWTALGASYVTAARAEGQNLDGRMAPEMVFPDGLNGVTPGTALSALRGKVVWVKFVLRDCPHCRKELPALQALHERWGGSGLVTLVVMHQFGPPDVEPFLRQFGYTFPVGIDPTGSLAQRYGVKRRPVDYVIGIDGRVRASNSSSEDVVRMELARYRLARVGDVPTSLSSVRDLVWNWNFGEALRTAEPAASTADAPDEVRAFVARLQAVAREELAARVEYANLLASRRNVPEARSIFDRVAAHFQGTSLEAEAAEARQRFLARLGG